VGALLSTPYSIGYVKYSVAQTAGLVNASIINLDGALVQPTVAILMQLSMRRLALFSALLLTGAVLASPIHMELPPTLLLI